MKGKGNGNGIVWGDPPPRRQGGETPGRWEELLAPFKDKPNEWGMVRAFPKSKGSSSASSYAAVINGKRKGGIKIPAGRWEACTRSIDEGENAGKIGLWVRYLGDDGK